MGPFTDRLNLSHFRCPWAIRSSGNSGLEAMQRLIFWLARQLHRIPARVGSLAALAAIVALIALHEAVGQWGKVAMAASIVVYFFAGHWTTLIWSLAGVALLYFVGAGHIHPRANTLVPIAWIGVSILVAWRWACDTRLLRKRPDNRTSEMRFRHVFWELLIVESIVATGAFYAWRLLVQKPLVATVSEAWGLPLGKAGEWADAILAMLLVGRMQVIIGCLLLIAGGTVVWAVCRSYGRHAPIPAMAPDHEGLYEIRRNASRSLSMVVRGISDIGPTVFHFVKDAWTLLRRFGRWLRRILRWNLILLGFMLQDMIFRGPVALLLGAILMAEVNSASGVADLIPAAACASMGLGTIVALALLVLYRCSSFDDQPQENRASTFSEFVWLAFTLAVVLSLLVGGGSALGAILGQRLDVGLAVPMAVLQILIVFGVAAMVGYLAGLGAKPARQEPPVATPPQAHA